MNTMGVFPGVQKVEKHWSKEPTTPAFSSDLHCAAKLGVEMYHLNKKFTTTE
jgi:hypothetical protein